MPDFLLIHGSCHGAWCWRDLIPALERLGHVARAIDLPANGDDPTPPSEATLEDSARAILDAATPETIVLGHSWAGFPISAAAEINPKGLKALVYLCAYVPVSGLSMVEMRKRGPRQTIAHAVILAEDGLSYTVDPDAVPNLFYHDCPEEAVAYARERLCPQATGPQDTPLTLGANYASVPRFYIICAEDRTIPPEYQRIMSQGWPEGTVVEMPTSHSPFFSDPDGLAAHLDRFARAL